MNKHKVYKSWMNGFVM